MRSAAIVLIVLALLYRLLPTVDMGWANFPPMMALAFWLVIAGLTPVTEETAPRVIPEPGTGVLVLLVGALLHRRARQARRRTGSLQNETPRGDIGMRRT